MGDKRHTNGYENGRKDGDCFITVGLELNFRKYKTKQHLFINGKKNRKIFNNGSIVCYGGSCYD